MAQLKGEGDCKNSGINSLQLLEVGANFENPSNTFLTSAAALLKGRSVGGRDLLTVTQAYVACSVTLRGETQFVKCCLSARRNIV